jgi:methyl-accepting chemotaxis protein
MSRTIATLLILLSGTPAISQQVRQAPAATAARTEAVRAIEESSARLSELAAVHARIVQTNAEMSKVYSALSRKISEVGKMAGERGRSREQLLQAIKQLEGMNQSFNMQYLGLQQKMQDESRRFTLLSNIMKTKHDSAKNSISNVR